MATLYRSRRTDGDDRGHLVGIPRLCARVGEPRRKRGFQSAREPSHDGTVSMRAGAAPAGVPGGAREGNVMERGEPPVPSRSRSYPLDAEWLEADGLGGFASGTVGGPRSRRYQALLLVAATPPTGRVALVNGAEAWVKTATGCFALSTQRYAPDVFYPDGRDRLVDFAPEPWPTWSFRLEDGTEIVHEVVAVHDQPRTVLRWRRGGGAGPAELVIRPLLSGRDYHGLHRENPAFGFEPDIDGSRCVWRPYPGLPAVVVAGNGLYRHEPVWYRNFLYVEEERRGLDCIEDLAAPGSFSFDLAQGAAVMILTAGECRDGDRGEAVEPTALAAQILDGEARRRAAFARPLHRAAASYIARRGKGRTVIAGYPWFADWGRDTFVALRGFMTVPGGLELARAILLEWAGTESRGMLPNRFADDGGTPEFNSVDAALWFVVAAHDFLLAARQAPPALGEGEEETLRRAMNRIIAGYRQGSRYGIRVDADGLLAAGEPGVQLTWMDAKVGDWVVTPRIGKPVEVQALWLNALRIAGAGPADLEAYRTARDGFQSRFWNHERGYLHDVVDADHVAGRDDPSLRPNQILAVGGLPYQVLGEPFATRVVEAVEVELLTPVGLRSLGPREPAYRPRYEGGRIERDGAYHQGTVWPWLMGPFIEAWLRVRGSTAAAKREAATRFLPPLQEGLGRAGLGHLSEIHDAEEPHLPRGCPFQAWSMGELLRIQALLDPEGPGHGSIDAAPAANVAAANGC